MGTMRLLTAITALLWLGLAPVAALAADPEETTADEAVVAAPFVAPAVEEAAPAPLEDLDPPALARRGFHLPATRFEMRIVVRERSVPGFLAEIGVQAWRSRYLALDVVLSGTVPHALGFVGPWRTMGSVDGLVDLGVEAGPFFTFGPSAGVAWRHFSQQGSHIAQYVVPVVGGRVSARVLRSRRFGLVLTAKVMGDLRPVDLILDQAAIERLRPIEAQFGLRFEFGHGRWS